MVPRQRTDSAGEGTGGTEYRTAAKKDGHSLAQRQVRIPEGTHEAFPEEERKDVRLPQGREAPEE